MPAAAKPLIAVTGSTGEKPLSWDWWSWQCIRLALHLSGAICRRVTPARPVTHYDGLLIAGGVDITPEIYGQRNTHSSNCEIERDRMEIALLDAAIEVGKPVLGICRGAQLINIAKGGTLHQEAGLFFRYYTPAKTIIGKLIPFKASYINNSRWLNGACAEDKKHRINSIHHQAIDRLGENLFRIADDHHGMTQAIEGKYDSFVVGLQWHPEFQLYSKCQRGVFKAFVQCCNTGSHSSAMQLALPLNRYSAST